MPLSESDYFKWYNDEISRYRNQEWQLVAYSVSLSSAVILFVRHTETRNLVAPHLAAGALIAFVTLLILAAFHVHYRLSQYRQRRDLLLSGADHRASNLPFGFFSGLWDFLYFVGFVAFPIIFAIAAAHVILSP